MTCRGIADPGVAFTMSTPAGRGPDRHGIQSVTILGIDLRPATLVVVGGVAAAIIPDPRVHPERRGRPYGATTASMVFMQGCQETASRTTPSSHPDVPRPRGQSLRRRRTRRAHDPVLDRREKLNGARACWPSPPAQILPGEHGGAGHHGVLKGGRCGTTPRRPGVFQFQRGIAWRRRRRTAHFADAKDAGWLAPLAAR